MSEPGSAPVSAMADLSQFVVMEAIIRTIAALAPDIEDEDAAWEAFIAWKKPEDRAYVEAIRRSGHSFFYYLQHEMYIFGAEVANRPAEGFSSECGREFTRRLFVENVFPFLQVALARTGELQTTVVDMYRMYMHRYTGPKFGLTDEVRTEEIVLTLRYADAEAAVAYFERYGLLAPQCFRNSVSLIWACFDQFLALAVDGYDSSKASLAASDYECVMRLPVKETDSLQYGTLIQTLASYVNELTLRKERATEDQRLESDLIVSSKAMRHAWECIRRASRGGQIVLLRGESGTGKSFVARKVHELSDRRSKPLVEVGLTSDIGSDNMVQSDLFGHEKGAFTGATGEKQGLFSLANGGTIFLDEIGDASPEVQARLLRVIESSTFKRLGSARDVKVDVRVIAATNRDLEKMVEEGTFRRDLYYRLNVIPIELPPLRERPDDIPALAEFLLARAGRSDPSLHKDLPPGLADDLRDYPWPGNIRELDHALRYAASMSDGPRITLDYLPEAVKAHLRGRSKKDRDKAVTAVSPAVRGRASGGPRDTDRVIDENALRRAIRAWGAIPAHDARAPFDNPAHLENAKRVYLGILIDELQGDLALIGKLWDRGSEKTLRRLIRQYGLAERFEAARAKGRPPK